MIEVLAMGESGQTAWVSVEACELPTADQPLRVAEFDDLFATAVRSVQRVEPARLRFELVAEPQVAARAADLAVRETGCCGFFTFTLTATDRQVCMDVVVPPDQIGVLDALADRATAGTRR